MKERIEYAFGFEVEWEDGYLYISEEDGSGAKYACESIEQAAKALGDYMLAIQFDKRLEDHAAEYEAELAMIKEHELMEENREW